MVLFVEWRPIASATYCGIGELFDSGLRSGVFEGAMLALRQSGVRHLPLENGEEYRVTRAITVRAARVVNKMPTQSCE